MIYPCYNACAKEYNIFKKMFDDKGNFEIVQIINYYVLKKKESEMQSN